MKLNQKCVFSVQELTFLGHNISAQGLSSMELEINVIINAPPPPPKDIKSLQSFLQLTGYYTKFLHHYAELVEPLWNMLQQGEVFHWLVEAQKF